MDVSEFLVNKREVESAEPVVDYSTMRCCTSRWIELDQMISTVLAREPSCAEIARAVRHSTRLVHLSGAISRITEPDTDYERAARELEDCGRMLR